MTRFHMLGTGGDPKTRMSAVEDFLTRARSAGVDVDTIFASNLGQIRVAHEIMAAEIDLGPSVDRARDRLATGVLEGSIDLEAALDEMATTELLKARGGARETFLQSLAVEAQKRVWWGFSAWGTRLITEVLQAGHDKVIERLRAVGPQLLDVTDDADAIRRGLATEWHEANQAHEAWETIHQLAIGVRESGLDKSVTKRVQTVQAFETHETRFREYERSTAVKRSDFPTPAMWLHARLAFEPAVLTTGEVIAYRARDAKRRMTELQKAEGERPRFESFGISDAELDQAIAEVEARSDRRSVDMRRSRT